MSGLPPKSRLTDGQHVLIGLIIIVFTLLGIAVVMRSALMKRRMGDFGCYARAAWAIRSGTSIYDATDDSGFHYNYPPLLAILMTPLADAPQHAAPHPQLCYGITILVWYLLSLLLLAIAVHWLAGALEEGSSLWGAPSESPAWWALRLGPVLVCAVPVGHTLVRGQTNLLLLCLFCGLIACAARGQSYRAGLCLAGSILLKVFPVYLLIYPLWRRDYRCLAGCAIGLTIGGIAIPVAVLGLPQTLACYRQFGEVTLGPALAVSADSSRSHELIAATATDSQSFQVTLHNTLHPARATRPAFPDAWVRWTARLAGGVLTLITLLAGRAAKSANDTCLVYAGLIIITLLLSPVCHLHYFCLAIPLLMALMVTTWRRRQDHRLGIGLTALFAVFALGNLVPTLPGCELLRDLGLAMYVALGLWLMAVVTLKSRRICTGTAHVVSGTGRTHPLVLTPLLGGEPRRRTDPTAA